MSRIAAQLEKQHGEGRVPNSGIVLETIKRFVQRVELSPYRDIKNVCYGIAEPYYGGQTLIGNKPLFITLLKIIDGFQTQPKKLKRCFQALMGAYFSLDGYDTKSAIHEQWLMLRIFLKRWLPALNSTDPRPDWLTAAIDHYNLFGPEPTARYGVDFLNGDGAVLEKTCKVLAIGSSSWVRRRVVISIIQAAAATSDEAFMGYLDALIELLRVNEVLKTEGIAKLLNRYAQKQSTPEHVALRVGALNAFGNPLIIANKQRWFSTSIEAREMVGNWLKGFLIERFFELLSHDGRTDKRRPGFWLQYRSSIENIWFILGPLAMSNSNEDFKKLRETMGNQCLSLLNSTAGNNAFIMKIGTKYIVEFGEQGNSTRLYDEDDLPLKLDQCSLSMSYVRKTLPLERLIHVSYGWEERFSDTLEQYGIYPDPLEKAPSKRKKFLHDFKQFCSERGLRFEHHVPTKRLVVYADPQNTVISEKFMKWGFIYEPSECYWSKIG